MPAAMSIAAKSMGKPLNEFQDLLDKGKIMSAEFLPKFAEEIRKTVRETGQLQASINSVRATRVAFLTSFKEALGKGFNEAASGMADFWTSLYSFMEFNQDAFKAFGEVVGLFFRILSYGITLVTPIFYVWSQLVESVRVSLNEAFDPSITRDKLGPFTTMVRILGGVFLILAGAVQYLIGTLQEAYALKDQNGFGEIFDVAKWLLVGSVVLRITRAILAMTTVLTGVKTAAIAARLSLGALALTPLGGMLLAVGGTYLAANYASKQLTGKSVTDHISDFLGTTPATPANTVSNSSKVSNVKIDSVTVNTQATDAAGIARDIGSSLEDQLRTH